MARRDHHRSSAQGISAPEGLQPVIQSPDGDCSVEPTRKTTVRCSTPSFPAAALKWTASTRRRSERRFSRICSSPLPAIELTKTLEAFQEN